MYYERIYLLIKMVIFAIIYTYKHLVYWLNGTYCAQDFFVHYMWTLLTSYN